MATYSRTWYGKKIWWARLFDARTGPYSTREQAEQVEYDEGRRMLKQSEENQRIRERIVHGMHGQKMIPVFAAWRSCRPLPNADDPASRRYNYIIVRVEETGEAGASSTNAGRVRAAIHNYAEFCGIRVADNLIRTDRPVTFYGTPQPVTEAEDLFRKVMPPQ